MPSPTSIAINAIPTPSAGGIKVVTIPRSMLGGAAGFSTGVGVKVAGGVLVGNGVALGTGVNVANG